MVLLFFCICSLLNQNYGAVGLDENCGYGVKYNLLKGGQKRMGKKKGVPLYSNLC